MFLFRPNIMKSLMKNEKKSSLLAIYQKVFSCLTPEWVISHEIIFEESTT